MGPLLVGRTAIGRVTVSVLNLNSIEVVETRQDLIDAGILVTQS
jgi:hypothetical protein